MKEKNIQKIIALLKSEDKQNVLLGIEFLESLKLKQGLLEHLNQKFPILWQEVNSEAKLTFSPEKLMDKNASDQSMDLFSELYQNFSQAIGHINWDKIGNSLVVIADMISRERENWMLKIINQDHKFCLYHQVTLTLDRAIVIIQEIERVNQAPISSNFSLSDLDKLENICELPVRFGLVKLEKNKVSFSLVYHIKKYFFR